MPGRCAQLGIPSKVMLIMDNAPCHPYIIADLDPKAKIIFLPPNTILLMQPLDQEVTANVKRFCHTCMFDFLDWWLRLMKKLMKSKVMMHTETKTSMNLYQIFLNYHQFHKCLHQKWLWLNFGESSLWSRHLNINEDTVNHAWQELVPHLCSKKASKSIQQVHEAEWALLVVVHGVAGCEEVT